MAIKQGTVKKRRVWTDAMLKEKKQNQKARKRKRATTAETPRKRRPGGIDAPERMP